MDNLKASLFQKIKYASVQRKHGTGRAALGPVDFHHRKIIEGGTKGELKTDGSQKESASQLVC